jgi:hypothetical protein
VHHQCVPPKRSGPDSRPGQGPAMAAAALGFLVLVSNAVTARRKKTKAPPRARVGLEHARHGVGVPGWRGFQPWHGDGDTLVSPATAPITSRPVPSSELPSRSGRNRWRKRERGCLISWRLGLERYGCGTHIYALGIRAPSGDFARIQRTPQIQRFIATCERPGAGWKMLCPTRRIHRMSAR